MLPLTHAESLLPSSRLRLFARLARALLWVLLAFWLLVGISWGLLHGWIVPRIADFRPTLEAAASQAVGVPVRIGSLSARSVGLNPSFEFNDVTLLDKAGRAALRLPQVVVGLSPTAISGWGIAQLVVDGAELDIRRSADGRIEVAGLDLAQESQERSVLADWALAQPELVLRGGQLRWTDEMRAAPPLVLTDVQAVLRNSGQRHRLRLDATPPPRWGERFSLRAVLREPFSLGTLGPLAPYFAQLFAAPLLPWHEGTGELFADFSRIDIAELRPYLDLSQDLHQNMAGLSADLASGHGALRLWAGLKDGELNSITADMALRGVQARLASHLQPLALASLSGRVSAQSLATGFALSTDALRFETDDGLRWPGGKLSWLHTAAEGSQPSQTELSADSLDLATLAALAARLPLPPEMHAELRSMSPQGRVEQLSARWQGPMAQAQGLSARGRVKGLVLGAALSDGDTESATDATRSASEASAPEVRPARPGVEQLDMDFELTAQGGQAQVAIVNGALSLPGVFSQPRLPLAELSGQMTWTLAPAADPPSPAGSPAPSSPDSSGYSSYLSRVQKLSLSDLKLRNADLTGRADLTWQAPPAGLPGPGTLDLQASASRAKANAVHRYLPQSLPALSSYMADAFVDGELSDLKFRLKGDLQHFPFTNPGQGDLQLSAQLKRLRYVYVPPSVADALHASHTRPSMGRAAVTASWPALDALDGELLIQRNRLEARQLQGRVLGLPGLQVTGGKVLIADLAAAELDIHFQVKGPLAQGLRFVNQSPVSAMLDDALVKATATGSADYSMRLQLPLATSGPTRLQASLNLPGNDLSLDPSAPLLGRTRGSLSLTEDSLRVNGQARVLGGDLQFEGGQAAPSRSDASPVMQFKGQGQFTAEGLQQARELGLVAQLAQQASGSASYQAALSVRRGQVEFKLSSALQGLALDLPAPLNKRAGDTLLLQMERSLLEASAATPGTTPTATPSTTPRARPVPLARNVSPAPLQDQLSLSLGERATLRYERALSDDAKPRVLRGRLALGLPAGEALSLPAQGVAAKLQLGQADLDSWLTSFSPASAGTPGPAGNTASHAMDAYLPNSLELRAQSMVYQGYALNQLVLQATREGALWRNRIEARELSGYAEFGQGSTANGHRLYARLTHLNLASNAARDVEAILSSTGSGTSAQTTQAVPALDVVVEDFELRGRKLGRLEVQAVNRPLPARDGNPREWWLRRLQLSSPEGALNASGTWAVSAASGQPSSGQRPPEQRRMALDFKLDVADAGALLKRLDMGGLVARGKGQLAGQLHWTGSPLALDYPSLGGQFNVQIERGQFLKAEPGIARLLGVLSLQSLPRRLTLDFRDVFSDGFAFDVLRGDLRIEQGLASTRNLQMKGVNAAVLMEGSADIARETQQLRVVVMPEVNAGAASLLASIANPAVGVGTFLAQLFLRGSINNAATQVFHIDGPWAEPRITRVERGAPDVAPARPAAGPESRP